MSSPIICQRRPALWDFIKRNPCPQANATSTGVAYLLRAAHYARGGFCGRWHGRSGRRQGRATVHSHACVCQIEVSIEAATARMAFLAPRRVRRRWNCACRWQFLTRTADQGGLHQGRFEPGTSAAHPGLRRLPALSSLHEHMQLHDNRCAGVAKRLMSMPISATIDLTTINGIDVSTALKVLSEIGPDLSRFKVPSTSVPGWCYARVSRFPRARSWPASPNAAATG